MAARNSTDLYRLPAGARLIICGRTGSGKSTLARRYLQNSPYHWVIFNPKGTSAFDKLAPQKTLETNINQNNVTASIRNTKYTNLKFPTGWDWQYQDALLRHILENFTNIGVLIDELTYIHASNGHAGTGLTGLLARGRELKQTFIGLCQRPAFVSKYVFSESDYLAQFRLLTDEDRRTLHKHTGKREALIQQTGHNFMFFDLVSDKVTAYRSAA